MTEDEFIDELYRRVADAWDARAWVAWFVGSAMLAGARLGRWARR